MVGDTYDVAEGIKMLPHQVAYLLPVLFLAIWFGSFYFYVRRAKKQVVHWRGYSTFRFFGSAGIVPEERRKQVWMKEEGYNEAEALILAKYQMRAGLYVLAGWIFVFVFAGHLIER